jgi:hypothetical protein
MNPQVEGKVYPDVAFQVAAERVSAFREVFGLPRGVPPTFPTAAEFAVLPIIVADPELGLDFTMVVHGSQRYVYRRPLVEGEELTVRARLQSIRRKGSNDFLVIAIDLVGAGGEIVCEATSTMVERGAEA